MALEPCVFTQEFASLSLKPQVTFTIFLKPQLALTLVQKAVISKFSHIKLSKGKFNLRFAMGLLLSLV